MPTLLSLTSITGPMVLGGQPRLSWSAVPSSSVAFPTMKMTFWVMPSPGTSTHLPKVGVSRRSLLPRWIPEQDTAFASIHWTHFVGSVHLIKLVNAKIIWEKIFLKWCYSFIFIFYICFVNKAYFFKLMTYNMPISPYIYKYHLYDICKRIWIWNVTTV